MKKTFAILALLISSPLSVSAQELLPVGPAALPPNAVHPQVAPTHAPSLKRKDSPAIRAVTGANCMCRTASSAFDAGNYKLAANLYQQAADQMTKAFGTPYVIDIGGALVGAANSCRELHQDRKAEQLYKQALTIGRRCGDGAVVIVNASDGIAKLYFPQGRAKEARALLLHNANVFKAKHDPLNYQRELSGYYTYDAWNAYHAGKKALAAARYEAGAEKLAKALGTQNSIAIAYSKNAAAGIYYNDLHQRQNAEVPYKQALTIFAKLGDKSESPAYASFALGDIYYQAGRTREARAMFQDAERLYKVANNAEYAKMAHDWVKFLDKGGKHSAH